MTRARRATQFDNYLFSVAGGDDKMGKDENETNAEFR